MNQLTLRSRHHDAGAAPFLSCSIDTSLPDHYDKGTETKVKKATISVLLLFLGISILSSQSLVEVAKKEKERREKLKGKKGIVITNEVLEKMKLEPSISIRSQGSLKSEVPVVSEMPEGRSLDHVPAQASSNKDHTAFFDIELLEVQWKEAQELVALLTLQLNALWHKYYNMNDLTPRDLIQQQISETYLRLQKAQLDAEQAKKDLEDARQKRRKNLSKIDERNLNP